MELTQQTEGYAEYETAMAAFDLVDPIYRKAVEYTRPLAAKWAEQNADKPCINVMAQRRPQPLQRRARHPLRQPVRWRTRLSARRQGARPQRHQGQRERVLQPPDLRADPQQRLHARALCRHPQGLYDAQLHVEA